MEVEEILKERLRRIEDAWRCKEPDTVPLAISMDCFPAKYCGVKVSEYLRNYDIFVRCALKVAQDFSFDQYSVLPGTGSMVLDLAFLDYTEVAASMKLVANTHEILGDVYTRWPGKELGENARFQFIGTELMRADEYDALIKDPIGFFSQEILPRMCKALSDPGSPRAKAALVRFGMEIQRLSDAMMKLTNELLRLGYPQVLGVFASAPLDIISDNLRDIKGMIADMYRIPEKVKMATEALKPYAEKLAIDFYNTLPPADVRKELFGTETILAMMPLHLNSFLSPKLYGEFYWPTLKDMILNFIDVGMLPWILYEGNQTPNLEFHLELLKKKTVAAIEKADWKKVRDLYKGHSCIQGGIYGSLLIGGTPSKVEEEVKRVMDLMKDGGGFILSVMDGGVPTEAKPENLKALVKAVEKYGKY